MGDFFKFVWRYAALSVWAVIVVSVGIFGFLQDGLQLVRGLKGWPFQLASFLGLAGFVVAALYRFHREHQAVPGLPALSAAPADDEPDSPSHKRRQLESMVMLTDRARRALRETRNLKPASDLWPSMRASLVTLQRDFGMPIPDEVEANPLANLKRAVDLMQEVLPLLRQGHDADALDLAQRIVGVA